MTKKPEREKPWYYEPNALKALRKWAKKKTLAHFSKNQGGSTHD